MPLSCLHVTYISRKFLHLFRWAGKEINQIYIVFTPFKNTYSFIFLMWKQSLCLLTYRYIFPDKIKSKYGNSSTQYYLGFITTSRRERKLFYSLWHILEPRKCLVQIVYCHLFLLFCFIIWIWLTREVLEINSRWWFLCQ